MATWSKIEVIANDFACASIIKILRNFKFEFWVQSIITSLFDKIYTAFHVTLRGVTVRVRFLRAAREIPRVLITI